MNAPVELCIENLDGSAQPSVLYLSPGETLGPIHIGASGKWRVTADGVAERHAALFFDGSQLFLQSVINESPVVAQGREVPTEWVIVEPPCQIELGSARFWFGPADTEDVSVEQEGEDPTRMAQRSDPEMPSRDDSTRIVPLESVIATVNRHRAKSDRRLPNFDPPPSQNLDLPKGFGAPEPSPSWSGADLEPAQPPSVDFDVPPLSASPVSQTKPLSETPPTPSMPTPTGDSLHSPGTVKMPDGGFPAPPGLVDTVGASVQDAQKIGWWAEASWVQKATAFLMLPALGAVMIIFFDIGVPPPQARTPSTTATASAAANPQVSTSTAVADVEPPDGPDVHEVDEMGLPAETSAPETSAAPEAKGKDKPAPKPRTRRGKRKGNKTLQRKAVDAIAAANYLKAAEHYDELAKQHPENKAYAAAADIARRKAKDAQK